MYGMYKWTDLFSPRQLLCHGTSAEVFREMLDADRANGELNEARHAAYGYLAVTLDTLLNYNNRSGRWDNTTGRVRSIFDRHGFAFVWSYAEMAPLIAGVGYDWLSTRPPSASTNSSPSSTPNPAAPPAICSPPPPPPERRPVARHPP